MTASTTPADIKILSEWGGSTTGSFCTNHHQPYPAIDPSSTTFPKPFVVAIVGASRGIGAGIAFSYAKAGASALILSSRRISGLEDTAAKIKEINSSIQVEIIPCDITKSDSVQSLAESIKSKHGRLDVAAINSGYSGPVILKMEDTDPSTFFNAIDVNYTGTFYCAKFLIPLLLASPNGAKAFIGINSLAALIVRGPIANAQYAVSKTAQLRLLEYVHEQYHDQGLVSYAVHPGAVKSEMALESAPEAFLEYLNDSADLCGAFCVWLTKGDAKEKAWLGGRLLSANWNVTELEAKKDEIVSKDLLKLRLTL